MAIRMISEQQSFTVAFPGHFNLFLMHSLFSSFLSVASENKNGGWSILNILGPTLGLGLGK